MSEQPKLRMIAGPNGSGKSTFINEVRKNGQFSIRHYINADDIQQAFNTSNQLDFSAYTIVVSFDDFLAFTKQSTLTPKLKEPIEEICQIENNIISLQKEEGSSYFAAW